MRADRLVAALLLMQTRSRVTAAELAAELEVSVATARRDLEALSAAGIPVYPQAGRGGGWALVGGARTDLSGLSATEAQALFLLAGPAAGAGPAVRSALRKLTRALPATFRADAAAAADAVIVDPARWGEDQRELPELVADLQTAVIRRLKVRIGYRNRAQEGSVQKGSAQEVLLRLVDPWGLVDKDDVWYLVAGTDAGQRTFRVDRITGAEITDLAAHRPAGFQLSDAWDAVVEHVERARSMSSATVITQPRLVSVLRGQFGRHCDVVDTVHDGRTRVRVAAPSPRSIAEHLAGLGAAIEVEEPESVRVELARLGAELVEMNRPPCSIDPG